MSRQEFQELIGLLEEECEIAADCNEENANIVRGMNSALTKLRRTLGKTTFTSEEIEAVKFALRDIGELYRFAGTSAGFHRNDFDSAEEITRARQFGERALQQANRLGVRL